MGGGGITSLKDLIIESRTNTVKDGDYTITYSASSNLSNINEEWGGTIRNEDKFWTGSGYYKLPQWWQVDLGRVENNICKFSFASGILFDNFIGCKNFKLSYSLDGIDFTDIYSGIYNQSKDPNFTLKYKTQYCNFNDISARYFRITILSIYGRENLNISKVTEARLYARNISLVLKESDNNIYGSVDNEIAQITTLDTWNNSSKEEKKNFFSAANNVLSIDQLKSLGKFKVLNEPKN